jgi:hypothetical protein
MKGHLTSTVAIPRWELYALLLVVLANWTLSLVLG